MTGKTSAAVRAKQQRTHPFHNLEGLVKCVVLLVLISAEVRLDALGRTTAYAAHQSDTPSGAMASQLRPFTVADSIEMTKFVDPPEGAGVVTPRFSPDGTHFLLVTERGRLDSNVRDYSLSIWDAHQLTKAPEQIATFKTSSNRPGIVDAKWLDAEHITLIGENSREIPQVYLINCRSREIQKLTSDPGGVVAYDVSLNRKTVAYYALWSGDQEENQQKEERGFAIKNERLSDLVTGGWRRPPFAYEMYVMDLSTQNIRKVDVGPFQTHHLILSVSPDGKYVVTEQGPFFVPTEWQSYDNRWVKQLAREFQGGQAALRPFGLRQAMLVDAITAEISPLLDAPARLLGVTWASDSRTVYVTGTYLPLNSKVGDSAVLRSSTVLAEVAVPEKQFHLISATPIAEFWGFRRDNSSNAIVTDIFNEGETEIGLSAHVSSVEWRKQGNDWVRRHYLEKSRDVEIRLSESLEQWPRLVRIDPATNAQTTVYDPNPQLKTRRFGHAEVIHWLGKRGESLTGGLVYPAGYTRGKRYPLVIQTHGFSPDQFLVDGPFTTALAAQALANKGIVVLQIGDSPLHEQSEGKLDEGPVTQSQIESAVDYLDNSGVIQRENVGLVGFSATGFDVRNTLIHSKYHFAAATSAEGNDHGYWAYIADGNNGSWAAQSEAPYGGPPWNRNWQAWMDNSISFNYDKFHTPLRLESDGNDFGEVLNEWENFVALKRLHKPVELIYVSHGAHPVVKPWDRLTSQQGNVDWMTFWLNGEEDPDPAKAEQYARWRELRKLQETITTRQPAQHSHHSVANRSGLE